jgi:hypothetical protein
MESLRERRIHNEAELLRLLALANPQKFEIDGFAGTLRQTTGLRVEDGRLAAAEEHSFILEFPRFFPSMPIEIFLRRPVFHPNVDPETGFVCLWDRHSPGASAIEAITRLQRIIAWDLFSDSADHSMQPAALQWRRRSRRDWELPLPFTPLTVPELYRAETSYREYPALRPRRRRLELK